jgi:predicted nucleic acid-binding protein
MAGFPSIANVVPDIAGVQQLFLDTAPIIYFVEGNPDFYPTCEKVFDVIDQGNAIGITGVVSFAEVLVVPLLGGDLSLAQLYRDILALLSPVSITPAIAEHAADLRARYSLKTPDALQLAAALASGCDGFLTGDQKLQRVTEPGLRVFVVSAVQPSP